jgi:hypothetical protein
MRFLINVIDSQSNSASGDEMAAIDAFNDGLRANGHWITAAGIEGPKGSILIDNRDGLGEVVHAPLYENDEYVSGFWLIEAKDEAEALELAKAGSKACNRRVELRKYL